MKNTDPFKKAPNRIGELIDVSDKTLKEISKEVNINYETLSAYKRQIRHPKKDNTKKLAEYFGVSIPYLLGLDDSPILINPGIPKAKKVLNGFEELMQLIETVVETRALDSYLQFMCFKDYSVESVSRLTQLIYDCLDQERRSFNHEND